MLQLSNQLYWQLHDIIMLKKKTGVIAMLDRTIFAAQSVEYCCILGPVSLTTKFGCLLNCNSCFWVIAMQSIV